MNKFWQQAGNFRGELGRNLLLASGGLMLMVLLTALIGIVANYSLGGRIRSVVAESVPAILGSSQLEPEARRLQQQAQQLAEADNLTAIASRQQSIERSLLRMSKIAGQLSQWYPEWAPALQKQILSSREAAEQLALAAQQRQTAVSAMRMIRMRLEWLHSDLVNELHYLSEDQLLALRRPVKKARGAAEISRVVVVLYQLRDAEQEVAEALLALSLPRQEPGGSHTLQQIKTGRLLVLARTLPDHLSGGLTPLLLSLQLLTADGGELDRALAHFRQSESLSLQKLAQLEERLVVQNKLAGSLGQRAEENARLQLKESVFFSRQAGWMVTLATVVSVSLMLWILFVLIGRKVIYRLSLLSRNMELVSQGQYQLPLTIGGQDEISRLGQQITGLAGMMNELERTNALALIAHTDAALLICDQEGRIRSINQAATRFYPQLAAGDDLSLLFTPQLWPLWCQLEPSGAMDVVLEGSAPEQYMRFMARCFLQNGDVYRMVTLLDVSAQIRSARWLEQMVAEKTAALDEINLALRSEIDERKRAQDSLVQATKFAVLGQTTTSLAHELNQPLAALTNYLYMAKLDVSQDQGELLKNLGQSEKVLDRMARLVRSYRTLGRHAPPSPVLYPVDIAQVLADITELLQGRIRTQQVSLVCDTAEVPLVSGEVVRLEQITLNLLGNALDAMAGRSDGVLHLSVLQSDGRVELYVADNGPGLPPEHIYSVFQPFFTSKKDGLGLGLSICRTLAEECHAEIRLASQLQGGALFILSMESQ